jgi:hypothetical protein
MLLIVAALQFVGVVADANVADGRVPSGADGGCECLSTWAYFGSLHHGCMSLVDPAWCFVDATCPAAQWSNADQHHWSHCSPSPTPPPKSSAAVLELVTALDDQKQWEWVGVLEGLVVPADLELTTGVDLTVNGVCRCQAEWEYGDTEWADPDSTNGGQQQPKSVHTGCMMDHADAPWCFATPGCALGGMVGGFDQEYSKSWMLCTLDGGGLYPHNKPHAPSSSSVGGGDSLWSSKLFAHLTITHFNRANGRLSTAQETQQQLSFFDLLPWTALAGTMHV